jgi:hypothetical protein
VRILLLVLSALALCGCAFGRTYSYADAPINIPGPGASSQSMALAVQDRRPYVLSGNKPVAFVGLMRGGFGNPFDVNTGSGRPLADEMRDALAKALKAKGFAVTTVGVNPSDSGDSARRRLAETGAKRSALVTFAEWKSDSMMNTDVHYDVVLVVLDEKGAPLATNSLKGMDNIGSAGLDPSLSVTQTFARKAESLFDDPKVISALRN